VARPARHQPKLCPPYNEGACSCQCPKCDGQGHPTGSYPTPVTDPQEMAGWMQREEDAYQKGRKALATELLDDIKYGGSSGDDDGADLSMVMDKLMEIENG